MKHSRWPERLANEASGRQNYAGIFDFAKRYLLTPNVSSGYRYPPLQLARMPPCKRRSKDGDRCTGMEMDLACPSRGVGASRRRGLCDRSS